MDRFRIMEPVFFYETPCHCIGSTGCSEEAAKAWEKARSEKRTDDAFEMARLDFPIFLKSSFAKDCDSEDLTSVMSNLGLTVSGTEYR